MIGCLQWFYVPMYVRKRIYCPLKESNFLEPQLVEVENYRILTISVVLFPFKIPFGEYLNMQTRKQQRYKTDNE